MPTPDSLTSIANEVDRVNVDVTGVAAGENLPQQTAAGLVAQSMAHSLAVATADATAALRNVETMMSTIQAAALTRWAESGASEDERSYQVIVRAAAQVSSEAVGLWREINETAQRLLRNLGQDVGEAAALTVEASPAASPEPATTSKTRPSKKKSSKKKPSKKKPSKKQAKQRASKKGKRSNAAKPKPAPAPTPVPDVAASNE